MSKPLDGTMIRRLGLGAGLLGATAATLIAAPSAAAAPDCSPAAVTSTVDSVTGSARQYLSTHPGANAVVNQAISQPRPQAAADVRSYFTANPQEYYELRGILAPIGEKQRQCQTTVLPPELASAYAEFMAG
ncbi:heme-binding protein [Mycobacterium sp. pW045]|uniref:heme-binding protein n=1 Tax=Mycobacterium sp. pW045 TaxID=3238984 RepID=UPI00351AD41D